MRENSDRWKEVDRDGKRWIEKIRGLQMVKNENGETGNGNRGDDIRRMGWEGAFSRSINRRLHLRSS